MSRALWRRLKRVHHLSGLIVSALCALAGWVLAGAADDPQLGRMLMGLIATDLTETGGLTVVSTSKVLAATREVSTAEGVAFDRLFLELMIRHHQGALVMVEELFSTPGGGQESWTYQFASDVDAAAPDSR